MNRYPIYIVSKGRWKNPKTAKMFISERVKFKILVEPQEYENYANSLGEDCVIELPFSNLGLGSYPARNYAWEHSILGGHKRHWVFDDNINGFRRYMYGKRIRCAAIPALRCAEDFSDRYINLAISGFDYDTFVRGELKKPFNLNVHVYSGLLIRNDIQYRWRMKYNEDVDLCLQVLHNKMCTVLFKAFLIEKTSTTSKMKGGNQDELYKGNAYEKKVLKARSLEEMWPQYAETKMRFNRPHHYVDWKKHFKHSLIRDKGFDFASLPGVNEYEMELKIKKKTDSAIVNKIIRLSNVLSGNIV